MGHQPVDPEEEDGNFFRGLKFATYIMTLVAIAVYLVFIRDWSAT